MAAANAKADRDKGKAQTSILEWIAALVGLVLLLAIVGMIASEAIRADDSPPDVSVRAKEVRRGASGYVLIVEASNRGGAPAAAVRVTGVLSAPGQPPASSELTFDYVPDHSTRTGGLFFAQDPRRGRLELTASGFAEP